MSTTARSEPVVLDILIQQRRDQCAAETFLKCVLAAAGAEPRVVITDKLASYRVLRLTMTSRCKSGQRRHQGTFVVWAAGRTARRLDNGSCVS